MNFHKLFLLPHQRGMAFDGKGLLQKALGDLRKALTCNAFSISAGTWRSEARAKIIEIQASARPGGMESSRRKGQAPGQYVGACPDRQTASHFGGTCSKPSATVNLQAQTLDAGAEDTAVKRKKRGLTASPFANDL